MPKGQSAADFLRQELKQRESVAENSTQFVFQAGCGAGVFLSMKPVVLRLALHSIHHCAPGGLLFKAAIERYPCAEGRLLKALFQHILDLFLSFSRAGLLSYSVPSFSLAGICYLTGKWQYLYVHSNFHVCISRSGNYGKLEGTQHCCQSVMYFRPLNGYLKHTKQQKIMSYISLSSCSPVSSVGMKAVTGHRAGGI